VRVTEDSRGKAKSEEVMARNFAEMIKDMILQVEAPCKLSRTKTETK